MDINNINHVGMAVRDLAATAARYEAMGFQLTPYSPHSAAWKPGDPVQPLGSGNRCIMFENTYLEILASEDPKRPAARITNFQFSSISRARETVFPRKEKLCLLTRNLCRGSNARHTV